MGKKTRFILLAVLIIGVVLFLRQRAESQKSPIETAKVSRQTIVESVSSSGKTKAQKQVDLHFQTSGRLAWVGVTEGDTVSAYQALASLDTQELTKNLEKALRDYSKERNDFEEDRLVTHKDQVVTDTVKRILEKNQWDLEKAVLDVELKDISLKWATLVSPISGTVIQIDTPIAGVNVTATDTFTVADPATIFFNANIDETDIGKISISQAADMNLDAYPDKTFRGSIVKIAFAAETTSGGATVYPVEIAFNEPQNLRMGLNGDVAIIISETANTLSIPNEAIREAGREHYVIKKTDRKYEKIQINIGLVSETDTQIIEGLSQGDEVVIKGFQALPKEIQM